MAEREEDDRKDNKKKDKDKEKGYKAFRAEDSDSAGEEPKEKDRGKKTVKREKSVVLKLINKKKKDKKKDKDKEKRPKHKKAEPQSPSHTPKKPIFGVPLAQAVKQSKSPDGVDLPKVLREGIVFIEENGLGIEGIYRVSGAKSKVDGLKELYNEGKSVDLKEYEPEVVAAVVKSYLRDLPENVLTTSLVPKFNELLGMQDKKEQLNQVKQLIKEMPVENRTLLSWVFTHMKHVIDRGSDNKMSIQNIGIVLSPTMSINHGILFIFLSNVEELFPDTQLKVYTGPLTFRVEEDEADLPSSPDAIASALAKQEELLAELHVKMQTTNDDDANELLWEVQRTVTQLKRKLKAAKEASKPKQKKDSKQNKKDKDEAEHIKVLEASEAELTIENEELTLIGDELRKRIADEREQIKRLQDEIATILQQQEAEQSMNDSGSESSDSETEVDETELESIMQDLIKQNEELEKRNTQLSQEIHEQREACAELKVKIRVLEQKKLEAEQKLEQEKMQSTTIAT
ncbi:ralA-binding protein 1-A isoform X3 [Exaiptasia diaphana]|uniref:Rho-GAP domain-containing protein n=1 Tax=Exaiptasia diaphana TaxID=2652724 RepID=A0A913WVM8_EXADI|nr:ralA-binding protein 1-A isoform X3 [Exaiptasia diaphana]